MTGYWHVPLVQEKQPNAESIFICISVHLPCLQSKEHLRFVIPLSSWSPSDFHRLNASCTYWRSGESTSPCWLGVSPGPGTNRARVQCQLQPACHRALEQHPGILHQPPKVWGRSDSGLWHRMRWLCRASSGSQAWPSITLHFSQVPKTCLRPPQPPKINFMHNCNFFLNVPLSKFCSHVGFCTQIQALLCHQGKCLISKQQKRTSV